MTITVVTPWFNHPELMTAYERAMGALNQGMGALNQGDDVLVIDNGSSPHIIQNPYWRWFPLKSNIGYSRACNKGLAEATTDAVLFLNNDIRMTSPDWLRTIKDELAPGVLVGAELTCPPYAIVDGCHIPYLSGWCLAGMTDDLRALGGFDETFEEPAYFGDNDLCLRARQAGMRLVAAPVGLKHLGNVTSRTMDVSGVSARNYERYAARARELLAVV